jgi:catecholate siderophore receptor
MRSIRIQLNVEPSPPTAAKTRMNRLTPLATALLALSATPAWSQTVAGAKPPPPAPPAAATTLESAAATTLSAGAVQTVQSVTIQGASPNDFSAGTTSLTKLPADLHDVPQSITVLSKELLQSQGAASLADALRNVPGITLGGAEGGQIGNNINLNGFSARTDIYLDGVRDRGQYYRDTFALENVEVLMGPSSMLFGRGSTGGVVNQASKTPQLKGLTDVTASVTTNGMVRTTLDHDRALDATTALRISAMAQDGAPTTRREMKNRDVGIAPSLKLGIGTPTEITLSALLQRNHDMPDYGVSPLNGRPADVPRNAFYGYEDDRTNQEVATFTALVQHRFSPDTLVRNQIQSNSVHVDARETASQTVGTLGPDPANPQNTIFLPAAAGGFSSAPLDTLYVRLQSHDRVISDHSVFDQTDFTTRLDTGIVHHDLLAGAEIGHDTYANQATYRNGSCNGFALNPAGGTSGYVGCESLTAPVVADSPADAPSAKGNYATASANTYGAYIGDTASIGSQFKLVGGLRRDRYDAQFANTITQPLAGAQDVSFTSVRAGAIWQPTLAQSYYASYSTSFNPSLEQLTNTTGTTAPLPPETNKSYETGAKVDLLNGRLSVNGAVFQVTQDNARSQNPDGSYQATGTVRVRGARIGGAGELARGWKVFAGYARLDATILQGIAVGTQGKVPANTPRDSATLWSTWEFLPHWELGGGSVYQGRRWMNNTDVTQVGGYTRWDGTLAYRGRACDVRLNVFNLGDRRYADMLIPSDGGRAVPGTGRSAMLSVSWHL